MKTLFQILILALFTTHFAGGQTYDELIKQGDEKFYAGDFENSIEIYKKAVEQYPEGVVGVFSLGYALGYSGFADDGIKYINKALTMAPDSISYRYARGELKGYKGDYQSAIEDLTY